MLELIFVTLKPNDNISLSFLQTFMQKNNSILLVNAQFSNPYLIRLIQKYLQFSFNKIFIFHFFHSSGCSLTLKQASSFDVLLLGNDFS